MAGIIKYKDVSKYSWLLIRSTYICAFVGHHNVKHSKEVLYGFGSKHHYTELQCLVKLMALTNIGWCFAVLWHSMGLTGNQ